MVSIIATVPVSLTHSETKADVFIRPNNILIKKKTQNEKQWYACQVFDYLAERYKIHATSFVIVELGHLRPILFNLAIKCGLQSFK